MRANEATPTRQTLSSKHPPTDNFYPTSIGFLHNLWQSVFAIRVIRWSCNGMRRNELRASQAISSEQRLENTSIPTLCCVVISKLEVLFVMFCACLSRYYGNFNISKRVKYLCSRFATGVFFLLKYSRRNFFVPWLPG